MDPGTMAGTDGDGIQKVLLTVLPSVVSGASGLVGALIGAWNTRRQYETQKPREMRERAFVRLRGLRLVVDQAARSLYEAKFKAETYYLRYRVTGDAEQKNLAFKEGDRIDVLVVRLNERLRELFEVMAEITIAFELDEGLRASASRESSPSRHQK